MGIYRGEVLAIMEALVGIHAHLQDIREVLEDEDGEEEEEVDS